MNDKDALFNDGVRLASAWCELNGTSMPTVRRLAHSDRLYHLATCAFYRPTTITIMVEKCASRGHGGRAWSWPAYAIDRTPYGVIQHELGHHLDHVKSEPAKSRDDVQSLFSWKIHDASHEPPMTGYLGTDAHAPTFFMEWFAEIFRVFVTNPDLCRRLRPKFYAAMLERGLQPVPGGSWNEALLAHGAPSRIIEQARKKMPEQKEEAGLWPATLTP